MAGRRPPELLLYLRCARDRLKAERPQALLHVRLDELDELAMEQGDDVVRCSGPEQGFDPAVAHDIGKADFGKTASFGSAGVGSSTHLGCLMLNLAMGVNVTHVPYRGAVPAMQDLIGGRIDYYCDIVPTALSQVQAGTVKAIAYLARSRSRRQRFPCSRPRMNKVWPTSTPRTGMGSFSRRTLRHRSYRSCKAR